MTVKSSSDKFERATRDRGSRLLLELYVSGTTPKSIRAVRNLTALAEEHPDIEFSITIVDVYKNPELAKQAQVFAVPTLIRLWPKPVKRLIGDLSNKERVVKSLGIKEPR